LEADMPRISLLALLATLLTAQSASADPMHSAGKHDGNKTATTTVIVIREGNRTNVTIVREPRSKDPSAGPDTSGRGGR
jgi:hypothetical protein